MQTQNQNPKTIRNLNQHSDIFNDRRTKRNRDKSTQKRNAIKESLRYEKED
jgi:hypothetical protein